MRKQILFILLSLLPVLAFSQKVTVQVIRAHEAGISDWQILDENQIPVFCGEEFLHEDTVSVVLEANRRYFLRFSVTQITSQDKNLYQVIIDREPVLIVGSANEPGSYNYPFFTGTRDDATKIIGGSDASISQYPWQVYIVAGNYQCGGSIIAPGWVLTAAHCVKPNGTLTPASSIKITAGSSTPATSGTKYNVSQVFVHNQYSLITLENDIALLKVNGSINCSDCKPIRLMNGYNAAEGFIDAGTMATITGWGLIQARPETLPQQLQMAKVPIVSSYAGASVFGTIPSTAIMAGYSNGNRDACSGDSGGPMTVFVEGETRLAGVISFGSEFCDTYGGYTNVSILEPWIRSTTGIVDYTLEVPSGDALVCQSTAGSNYSTEAVAGDPVYEWKTFPLNAGEIDWTSLNATVDWNPGFIGNATIKARVFVNGKYSEWGRRNVLRTWDTKITDQSKDTVICEGNALNLDVKAGGTSLVYDWYKGADLIQSERYSSLDYASVLPENSGIYRCQVTGLCGSFSTSLINVTAHPLTLIQSISPDVSAFFGNDLSLEVNAAGYDLIYEWWKNGSPLENSNSSSIIMSDVNARNIGLYKSVVSGYCGTEVSDPVYVYLQENVNSENKELSVWPTATSNEVNIAPAGDAEYNLQIISPSGKLMFNSTKCRYRTTVNIGNYPKGFYILKITGPGISRSVKVVKE